MAGFLEKKLIERSVNRWESITNQADTLPPNELTTLNATAVKLRRSLEKLNCAAQLALTPNPDAGIQRPDQCDWAWRPEPWKQVKLPHGQVEVPSPYYLSDSVALFHDCAKSEITLRQMRNARGESPAGFATSIDVLRFDGSFLSLVTTLPKEAASGLTRSHFVSLRCQISTENPIEIFARLNVQHGPNTEQMVRQLDISEELGVAEFDLAYSNINEKRVEKVWIDLIFDNPAMNQVTLWDLTLTRAPRADL